MKTLIMTHSCSIHDKQNTTAELAKILIAQNYYCTCTLKVEQCVGGGVAAVVVYLFVYTRIAVSSSMFCSHQCSPVMCINNMGGGSRIWERGGGVEKEGMRNEELEMRHDEVRVGERGNGTRGKRSFLNMNAKKKK